MTVEDFQSPVAEAAPADVQTDKTQDPNGANSSVKGPESMVPEIDQDNFVEPESPQTIAAAQQRGLSAQESGQKENLATDAQRRSKSEMVGEPAQQQQ